MVEKCSHLIFEIEPICPACGRFRGGYCSKIQDWVTTWHPEKKKTVCESCKFFDLGV